MKEPILVIMAAGMGSRYGGLKQIDPITEEGEIIMDFSIYDAVRAGFKRAILIINGQHEQDFKDAIGNRLADYINVTYVHQDLDTLPEGFTVPDGRTKPWGTTHAIWCCKDAVDAPFVILNADDYYGPEAFKFMYNHLSNIECVHHSDYAMVGYILANTLTDNGYVTRGVCQLENAYLTEIIERKQIARRDGSIKYFENNQWVDIPGNSLVSMNMWALTPAVFNQLEDALVTFLKQDVPLDPCKAEILIPTTIGNLINQGVATVKMYPSKDTWHGVTYKEDKPQVMEALAKLKEEKLYPQKLWT